MSARQVSTSVTWGDVAVYFATLAVFALAFAVRLGDFRQRMTERAGPNGFRAGMVFGAAVYGFFIAVGILMIFHAARV